MIRPLAYAAFQRKSATAFHGRTLKRSRQAREPAPFVRISSPRAAHRALRVTRAGYGTYGTTTIHTSMHQATPLALAAFTLLSLGAMAQVPSACLEVESILVDACVSDADCPGSTEGMNEMVRFITGPAPIALADLQVTFYSSSFLGIVQDAATAAITAQLNASIQGCGQLLEPPGGIIPPGSRVIFITSTALCMQANPFTGLNDTLYIIFQTPGNSQGHFKNNDLVGQPVTTVPNAPLLCWLRVGVAGACEDTVTYDANLLVNTMGSYGGSSAENDGATVEFAWPGAATASYVNHGCMAAFEPTLPEVVSGGGPVDCNALAALVGSVSGTYASVHWQGGNGTFTAADALATDYIPSMADTGTVALSFCAVSPCGDTICAPVSITIAAPPVAHFSWAPEEPTVADDEVQFFDQSTGAVSWLWQLSGLSGNSDTTASPVAAIPGAGCWTVVLTVTNAAGCVDTASAQVCVAAADSLLVPNIFTPNNDGSNDVFRVTGGNLASLDLQVFNRWGQEVARLERVNQVWDGRTMAGEEMAAGTYFYTVQAVGKDGRMLAQTGTLTLLR